MGCSRLTRSTSRSCPAGTVSATSHFVCSASNVIDAGSASRYTSAMLPGGAGSLTRSAVSAPLPLGLALAFAALSLVSLVIPPAARSSMIFSWRARKPSINDSGRGGQPGTYTSTGMMLSTPCSTRSYCV